MVRFSTIANLKTWGLVVVIKALKEQEAQMSISYYACPSPTTHSIGWWLKRTNQT